MAFEDKLNKHNSHSVVILPRFHKYKERLIPGLYCEDCASLIKWLKPAHAKELIEMGVPKLEPSRADVESLLQFLQIPLENLDKEFWDDNFINKPNSSYTIRPSNEPMVQWQPKDLGI